VIRRVTIERVRRADDFRTRLVGLMGRRDLSDSFLLLPRCRSVHTCFMRGAIDIVFLDDAATVVGAHRAVGPWRLLFGPEGTRDTLELPAGTIEQRDLKPGDGIECRYD
jgi:uncharacterized membrane protein (UPF0127 family)